MASAGIVLWDWQEQPDWSEIDRHLARFRRVGVMPKIFEVNTQEDSYAIVIAPASWTKRMAQAEYESQLNAIE